MRVSLSFEDVAVGSSSFMMNHELARRHRSYWNAESIHSFRSGDSFYFADDGQGLSYSLGQVLFRNLMADYRLPSFKACIPLPEKQAMDAIAIIKKDAAKNRHEVLFLGWD